MQMIIPDGFARDSTTTTTTTTTTKRYMTLYALYKVLVNPKKCYDNDTNVEKCQKGNNKRNKKKDSKAHVDTETGMKKLG